MVQYWGPAGTVTALVKKLQGEITSILLADGAITDTDGAITDLFI